MKDDFAWRFLAARDKDLSPHQSWRKKGGDYFTNELSLWFVRPLEYLEEADWQSALLCGAESGALSLRLHFRHACDEATALELVLLYQEAYLAPLMKRGVLGALFGSTLFVAMQLYSRNDTPPEGRPKLLTHEEFERKLKPYGAERIPRARLQKN